MNPAYGRSNAAHVYIMTDPKWTTLHVGVTTNLERLLWEKRHNLFDAQTTDGLHLNILLHWEAYNRMDKALSRYQLLQGWCRSRKAALVGTRNPNWLDWSEAYLNQ